MNEGDRFTFRGVTYEAVRRYGTSGRSGRGSRCDECDALKTKHCNFLPKCRNYKIVFIYKIVDPNKIKIKRDSRFHLIEPTESAK